MICYITEETNLYRTSNASVNQRECCGPHIFTGKLLIRSSFFGSEYTVNQEKSIFGLQNGAILVRTRSAIVGSNTFKFSKADLDSWTEMSSRMGWTGYVI